jgi:hypothetical protein
MARLPVPGADTNQWGEILNDYLLASHNADGSLQTTAVPDIDASKITSGVFDAARIPSTSRVYTFSKTNSTLATEAGLHRFYNDTGKTWTIQYVRATVGIAPTGASLIVDVNRDGTTIFTNQANRPTIAASSNSSGKNTDMDITTVADGSYLTVDIDQIGSTIAGGALTVQVEVVY